MSFRDGAASQAIAQNETGVDACGRSDENIHLDAPNMRHPALSERVEKKTAMGMKCSRHEEPRG